MQQLKEYIINDTNSTVLVDELMKKHTKIKSRNPIAQMLMKKQFQSRIVKNKKPKLIEKYLDNKIKYD